MNLLNQARSWVSSQENSQIEESNTEQQQFLWDTVFKTVSQTTTQLSETVTLAFSDKKQESTSNKTQNPVNSNLLNLSEEENLAFYGALFAMAAADGSISPEESDIILKSINIKQFSAEGKRQLQSYLQWPPSLEFCLNKLPLYNDTLRWKLLFYLIEIATLDQALDQGEKEALRKVKSYLKVSTEQIKAIYFFIQTLKKIGSGKLELNEINEMTEKAIARLEANQIEIPKAFNSENHNESKKNQSYYSEESFWKTIENFSCSAGKEVVEKYFTLYYAAEDANLVIDKKALILAALGYLIPAVGLGDDLVMLLKVVLTIASNITPEVQEKARQQTNQFLG